MMTKHVLFVLTSHDDLAGTGAKTGTWLEELAASYYVLADAGHKVTIASVKGGDAPLDPASFEDPWVTDTGKRFLADNAAMAAVRASLAIAAVKPADYDAVYMIGGAGTAWDFPNNATLGNLLAGVQGKGGVIAAVCHGVLGLLNDNGGKILAAGRHITCISDKEDEMAGYDKLVPMLPESTFRAAGAQVTVGAPFEAHVIVDGTIVTGQNPASAGVVSRAILTQLGA